MNEKEYIQTILKGAILGFKKSAEDKYTEKLSTFVGVIYDMCMFFDDKPKDFNKNTLKANIEKQIRDHDGCRIYLVKTIEYIELI